MQFTIFRSARNQLTVLGLLAGIGMISITATNGAAAQPAGTAAESVTVTATAEAPSGVFGWD
jgi:hypothetical protein